MPCLTTSAIMLFQLLFVIHPILAFFPTKIFHHHYHKITTLPPLNAKKEAHLMSKNKLTHVMLRVPDVNTTVRYWKGCGANLGSYRKTSKSETAFVNFGENGFSLEITALSPEEESFLGNSVQYLGLSMLLKFNVSSSTHPPNVDVDPNGMEVRYVASAPGDYVSRFCLRSATKETFTSTSEFYVNVLGMEEVAADETCICLRYPKEKEEGVPITLVFVWDNQTLEKGNYFDHMAISTENMDDAVKVVREVGGDDFVVMEPTSMFGTKVMGLKDPNGYDVYLFEKKE